MSEPDHDMASLLEAADPAFDAVMTCVSGIREHETRTCLRCSTPEVRLPVHRRVAARGQGDAPRGPGRLTETVHGVIGEFEGET